MILGPEGKKHFDLKYSKAIMDCFCFWEGEGKKADQGIFLIPKTELASSLRLQGEALWPVHVAPAANPHTSTPHRCWQDAYKFRERKVVYTAML